MSRHGWINIEGIVPVKDAFYRYQMPPLRGHTEKTWTVLPFFSKTTNALHRQEEEVLKHLGLSLHTQTKFDQGRACLKGQFPDRELHCVLRRYIEDFVLCGGCKKPETAYRIRKSGSIVQKCFGCGHKTPLDMDHKLCSFIKSQYRAVKATRQIQLQPQDMAHPLAHESHPFEAERAKGRPKRRSKQANGDKSKEQESPAPMSDEAAMEEAVCEVQNALQTPGQMSVSQLLRLVSSEQRASVLSSRERIRILVKAAEIDPDTKQFDEVIYGVLEKIVKESPLMRGFMEEYVIVCLEEAAAASSSSKGVGVTFVSHLKACYEEEVLMEETIVYWWKGTSSRCESLVHQSVRSRLQRVSAPLIEWLKKEEEEDSDCSDDA